MSEHAAAHLVVLERSHPVGVLSTLDVAAALATRPSLS
jgi:CBS domain-containing protein